MSTFSEEFNVDFVDEYGNNQLHLAIYTGNVNDSCLDSIFRLLNTGIDVNRRNHENKTPLDYAVHLKQIKIAEVLLNNGAEVNREDSHYSALTVAIWAKDGPLIELLLNYGASLDYRNAVDNMSPFLYLSWLTDSSLIATIIQRTANINQCTNTGMTLLHLASEMGNAILVQMLLEGGAEVNIIALDSGRTPLHIAIENSDLKVINLLSDHGADFSAQCNLGLGVLQLAACNPRGEVMSFLLDKGLDINNKDSRGRTPLQCVSYPDPCNVLLVRGADISCKNIYGETTLVNMVQCRNDWIEVARNVSIDENLITRANGLIKLLVAHTAKLEYLNLIQIDEDTRQLMEHNVDLDEYYKICKNEFQKKIYNDLSLLDILYAKKNMMSAFARNKDLVTAVNTVVPLLCKDIHTFYSLMLVKFEKELWRQRQREKIQKVLCDIMKLNDPQHIICEIIASYLEDDDLEMY